MSNHFPEVLSPAAQKESPALNSIFLNFTWTTWYVSYGINFSDYSPKRCVLSYTVPSSNSNGQSFKKVSRSLKVTRCLPFLIWPPFTKRAFLSCLCQRFSLRQWGKNGFLMLISIKNFVLVRKDEHLLVDTHLHWFYLKR